MGEISTLTRFSFKLFLSRQNDFGSQKRRFRATTVADEHRKYRVEWKRGEKLPPNIVTGVGE